MTAWNRINNIDVDVLDELNYSISDAVIQSIIIQSDSFLYYSDVWNLKDTVVLVVSAIYWSWKFSAYRCFIFARFEQIHDQIS